MRHPRIKYPHAIYHLYNQGVNRSDIFFDPEDNEAWLSLIYGTIRKFSTSIFCFVTMQNHYHCLMETTHPNISEVMQYVGFMFAKHINKKHGRVGYLFRNRYQGQLVENLSYLRTVIAYIHNNPLEAGMISDIEEEHPMVLTSYHDLAGNTNHYPWLARSRLFDFFQVSPWEKNAISNLWQPIDLETFKELTKIEKSVQKVTNMKE